MTPESNTHLLDRAAAATDQASAQVLGAAQRGVSAVRDTSQHLVDRVQHATDSTTAYVRAQPVKSMLMAAAAGATLVALLSLLTRPRH
jgi:ElaB/YqjD/DUF883 family membrane-anchored ribosome-binding protein